MKFYILICSFLWRGRRQDVGSFYIFKRTVCPTLRLSAEWVFITPSGGKVCIPSVSALSVCSISHILALVCGGVCRRRWHMVYKPSAYNTFLRDCVQWQRGSNAIAKCICSSKLEKTITVLIKKNIHCWVCRCIINFFSK